MRIRIRKELQGLLPAWGLAVAVPAAGLFLFGRLQHLFNGALALFAICTAVLGAAALGTEFENGTLPMLLTQPVARRRLWREKMAALAAALASASAVFALTAGTPWDVTLFVLLPAAGAFGIAPWLALLVRNGLAAAALTVGIEGAVYHGVALILGEYPEGNRISPEFATATGTIFLGLSAAGCLLGREAFQRWEPAGRSLSATRRRWTVRTPPRFRAGGMLMNLAAKELRLHRFSLFAAAALCAAFAIAAILPLGDVGPQVLRNLVFVYVLVVPAAAGAAAVATERSFGLLEWHLTLPPSARRQWLVKSGVAVASGVGLGFLLPWALAAMLGRLTPPAAPGWFSTANYFFLAVLGTSVGVHTSASARSSLRAFTGAFGVIAVALFFHDWLLGRLAVHATGLKFTAPGSTILLLVALAGLAAALNWSACCDYRFGGRRQLTSRARLAALVLLFVTARVWLAR